MKRLSALLLALCLLCTLCACGNGASDASDGAAPSPLESEGAAGAPTTGGTEVDLTKSLYEFASGLPDGDIAMTVDGADVPNEVYFHWLVSYCDYITYQYAMYGMIPDFTDSELAGALADAVQDVVIYFAVVHRLAEQYDAGLTAEQSEELSLLSEDALQRGDSLSDESFLYINSAEYLRENLKALLTDPSDDEGFAQYIAGKNVFACKHILLMTADEDQTGEDGVTVTAEEYNAQRRALAESLLAQLNAAADKEALLDELAEEFSEDGRDSDGHLAAPEGYTFDDDDSLVGGFREATLAVEPGELTGIVETDYGYHIILRLPVSSDTLEGYRAQWLDDGLESILTAEAEKADVSVSAAAASVDLAEFYDRYSAYSQEESGETPAD